MNKTIRSLLSIILLSFCLSSAGPAGAKPIERLISTDALVTELLFALGADQHLVAVDVTSQLPQGYRSLANVGYHRRLSAEGLLALQPTLVIGSELIGPAEVLSALQQAEVSLIKLPSAETVAELRANIQLLAAAVSRRAEAAQLLDQIAAQVNSLQRRSLGGQRSAFLLSLAADSLRLAGRDTSGSAFIELVQGENVAQFKNYRNVSAESLLALQPEVIIVASSNPERGLAEVLAANPMLQYTPAGRSGKIIAMDGSALMAGLSPAAIEQALQVVDAMTRREAP